LEESNTLKLLLEKVGKYHPLYGGGLATHLPMVLIALRELNAPNNKLHSVFEESVKGLEVVDGLDKIEPVKTIEQALGDISYYKSYLKFFNIELELYGTDTVLKKTLPILVSGIAASAFHALIRLAYAIEANCKSEIAIALAYWCVEYQAFELNSAPCDEKLESILVRLSPLGEEHQFSPGLIVSRMNEIGDVLKQNKCVIQPETLSLTQLRNFALESFYHNDDFTLLHTVTGCHAFSSILPYLEEKEVALKELWKAILVACLSTGIRFENKSIKGVESSGDFAPLVAYAIKSNDSHVIKLVYSCLCEYQKRNDPLYHLVAQRAVEES